MKNKDLKKEAIALQTRAMLLSLVAVFVVYLTLSMSSAAASPSTVTETKTKDLKVAGLVTFDSSIQASSGETITITLHSSQYGYTISDLTLHKSTPRGMGSISGVTVSTSGMTVDVTVTSGGDRTLHLWLWLTSGEHVGVNVHF